MVSLLLTDPRVDPNITRKTRISPFFSSCGEGHQEVVALLLADPRIDVTATMEDGVTPFNVACFSGHYEVVSLLLTDPRIDPNVPDNTNDTPLLVTAQNGHLSVVQRLLASGWEIDTNAKSAINNRTAVEQAKWAATQPKWSILRDDPLVRQVNCPLIIQLIEEYNHDPQRTRTRLRALPELRDHFIGHLYALVIFHSDELVRLTGSSLSKVGRFFAICAALPLDLQMLLCNRVFGSPKDFILSGCSESGFKWLARFTTWNSPLCATTPTIPGAKVSGRTTGRDTR